MMEERSSLYKEAGVDIEAGNRFVELIRPIVRSTLKPHVMTEIGGFAGCFSLKSLDIKDPIILASTDGVGTKLKIAFMMDRHDTVGIDLVAMCVNDIMVQGADPLFMLDYLSMGRLDIDRAVQIIRGIAEGCKEAGCSLIGGETAEMPGIYKEDEYDLAGFVVGIVEDQSLMDGSDISAGDQLIGIASSGLHSNGYSLVRKIFFEKLKMKVESYVEEFGRTLGEELLEPTRIYSRLIKNLKRDFHIAGIAHITGGGIIYNLPRILPKKCRAVIKEKSWPRHAIFQYLQREGKITKGEMMKVFNNGLGLIMVVKRDEFDEIILRLKAMGESAFHIGHIEERVGDEPMIKFI